MRLAILLTIALGLFGCEDTPSIEDLCARIATCEASTPAEEQVVFDECVDEGDFVAEQSFEYDCEDQLDEYLFCIDEAECDWWYECEEERDEFAFCVDGLPLD